MPEAASGGPERREALRPTFNRVSLARSTLQGKVVSAVSGEPQNRVVVTLSDRSGRFIPRTTTTDDSGDFSIVLPEGDWIASVSKPGDEDVSATIDHYLTVSGGVITDDQNREVTLLTINR